MYDTKKMHPDLKIEIETYHKRKMILDYYYDKFQHYLEFIQERKNYDLSMYNDFDGICKPIPTGKRLTKEKKNSIDIYYNTVTKTEFEYIQRNINRECINVIEGNKPYYTHKDIFDPDDEKYGLYEDSGQKVEFKTELRGQYAKTCPGSDLKTKNGT